MKGAKKAAERPIAYWFFRPLFCVKPLQVMLPFGVIIRRLIWRVVVVKGLLMEHKKAAMFMHCGLE